MNNNLEVLFELDPEATFDENPDWVYQYDPTWVMHNRLTWMVENRPGSITACQPNIQLDYIITKWISL